MWLNFCFSSSECFCSGIKPLCKEPDDIQMEQAGVECCQTAKNCSNVLELCNPAWFVPLHIADSTNALHCEVVDSGIGPYINSQRYQKMFDNHSVHYQGQGQCQTQS